MSTSDYHHGDLREALLKVGEDLLQEAGPEGLSLREAARRVGVSHNAPYKHFPSREAMLAALAVRGFETLAARIREADADDGGIARGMAYVGFALDHPDQFRLMFSGAIDRDSFPELRAAAAAGLAELGDFANRTYGADALDAATLSAWAFVHGLAQLMIDNQVPGAFTDTGKRAAARRALSAMAHALAAAGAG